MINSETRSVFIYRENSWRIPLIDMWQILPGIGVRLEDQKNAPSSWKYIDPETLKQQKIAKEQVDITRCSLSILRKWWRILTSWQMSEEAEKSRKVELERRERAKIPPQKMFLDDSNYSKFDAEVRFFQFFMLYMKLIYSETTLWQKI